MRILDDTWQSVRVWYMCSAVWLMAPAIGSGLAAVITECIMQSRRYVTKWRASSHCQSGSTYVVNLIAFAAATVDSGANIQKLLNSLKVFFAMENRQERANYSSLYKCRGTQQKQFAYLR